jgi:acyl-coenzyme A synthetase/AMP-(fatty) acid ligase
MSRAHHESAAPHASCEAPDGPALVDWLASDAAVRDRLIADAHHSIAYADLPELLHRLDSHLARGGVTGDVPLALECSQSLAGAVAIAYALSRARSVVLLPDLTDLSKEAGQARFIPSFCSHVVTAAARRSEAFSPETAITCTANPAFAPDPTVSSFTGPDFYLRTSGSTEGAKLTRMPHQRWLNNATGCVDRWTLTAADRFSVPVPIFHSYGFGAAFLPGLLVGASMDLIRGGNILTCLERETRFSPNVAFLTPAMCETFLARRRTPRPYRLTVTAGDRVKPETVAGFDTRFGPLLNLYGSAEMGAVSAPSPDDPLDARLGTAGRPLAGIRLRIASDRSESASDAAGGMLECQQRNSHCGYLIQDEQWRFEPHQPDAWFAMGDLATIRADGAVAIVGRSALSVKRDGLMVVLADVEAVLESVDGVQRAVVIAAGESRRGQRLVGVCLAAGRGPDPDVVRRTCLERLPLYAAPDDVVIVDAFPQLPSGKIDRRALHTWLQSSPT